MDRGSIASNISLPACIGLSVAGGLARLRTLVAILMLILGASPLLAQNESEAGERRGRWVSFGFGAGHGGIDCSHCGHLLSNDPWDGGTGVTGFASIGGTITPALLVGGELNVWAKAQRQDGRQRDATLMLVGPVVRYFPVPGVGLHVSAAGGYGASILAGGPGLIESGGLGIRGGVAWDFRLGRRIALAPFASYIKLFSEGAAGRNRGEPAVGPDDPFYMQFGVSVSWY